MQGFQIGAFIDKKNERKRKLQLANAIPYWF